ncbi:MAG: hypothetical protein ACR5KV_04385 [Wolbachia sp.]
MKNLTKFNLGNNEIGDEGAKALASGNFTKLHLEKNNVDDEGMKALTNGNITQLYLWDNNTSANQESENPKEKSLIMSIRTTVNSVLTAIKSIIPDMSTERPR